MSPSEKFPLYTINETISYTKEAIYKAEKAKAIERELHATFGPAIDLPKTPSICQNLRD